MTMRFCAAVLISLILSFVVVQTSSVPVRARYGMVLSQEERASTIGADILREGGTAVDAAIATAFALAVTHPAAGNVGGGGFMVYRAANGDAVTYDFREMAPARSSPTMFTKNGTYDFDVHHNSHLSVGVPGTVAGLHLAWKEQGKLPWRRLVDPAIRLAKDGFVVTEGFALSLRETLDEFKRYPASLAQFSKNGTAYEAGETFRQPDLARTLERIAAQGPAGFYEGETALLIEKEITANGGFITREDLKNYKAIKRNPVRGTYRGYEVLSMPPISSGGVGLIEMLNILEGYDLGKVGYRSADSVHLIAESMRRAYADRAKYLGDPDFVKNMPIDRLISKEYAADLRKSITMERATKSSPTTFEWPNEAGETTHLSVVDGNRNAVAMTYTLEYTYGSRIVVPGAGFLLNNEMGDFNAAPGLTNAEGLIGTDPNLAQPGKRMLSSMTPSILSKDGKLFMVTGSPGGRTIINTVLLTILNAVDYAMNAQEAVDACRFHHQWLPDRIVFEKYGLSPDTVAILEARGHELRPTDDQGVAEVITVNEKENVLEGGIDRRAPDGGAGLVVRK
jgi:gamma-glutamyltranspeptidase / glutathione hydrolase